MIANFAQDVKDIWIFLEDNDILEGGEIEGEVLDSSNPHLDPGTLYVQYREGFENARPSVGREQTEGRVDDFEIIVGDQITRKLNSGAIYHDRVGTFQEIPEASKLWIFPSNNRGEYSYLLEDLEFYRSLDKEQRQVYSDIE